MSTAESVNFATSRRVRRVFEPFPFLEDGLEIGFANAEGEEFNFDESVFVVENSLANRGFFPRFHFKFAAGMIVERLGIDVGDLDLAILYRDPIGKHYRILEKWPLNSVPTEWAHSEEPLRFASYCRLTCGIVLNKSLSPEPGKPTEWAPSSEKK